MLIAYTREVSPALADCELTHLEREPLDVAGAQAEHEVYESVLERLGARVRRLPSTPHLPDGVFVEDAAVVLDDVAVITRPGAPSRQPETASVEAALAAPRPLVHVRAPATLDGGDVLVAGRRIYIGLSTRTSRARAGMLPWMDHRAAQRQRICGVRLGRVDCQRPQAGKSTCRDPTWSTISWQLSLYKLSAASN